MSTELAVIFGITLYKLSCLTVGSLFSILGYRLFKSGIWGNAGDLETNFKDSKIVLKSAAPGTFFAVLGAAVIITTIWQGINFTLESKEPSTLKQPQLPEPK